MSNPPPTVLQLARQGDPEAIAALMNRHLEAQGITAHVVQHDSTLQVNLEAAQVPNQTDLVAYVKKGITGLELATVQQLTVSGKQLGADASAWSENLVLQDPSISDFDVDLGLDAAPASNDLDLGFDLDSPTGSDPDLDDLSFDAALGDDLNGAGLVELTDSPGDLDFDAAADFDLSFTDSPSDFDLDLTDTSLTAPNGDLEAADDFSLEFTDTSDAGGDLDFDLDLSETASDPAAADLDFDLGLSDPAAATPDDFDLDLVDTPAADLSTTEASLGEGADVTDLDFDLSFEDAPASAEDNLTFDLGSLDDPEGNPAGDFDLDFALGDLAMNDEAAAASAEDLDLDLGPDPSPAVGADADLAFDLDGEEPFTHDPLDVDLGLEDTPTGAGDELDFSLIPNDALDLDFAAADEAALGLEAEQWPAASEPDEVAAFDLVEGDLVEGSPGLSETIGGGEAIASDDFGLDLDADAPAAPPTAPDVDVDLDDLWSSSEASADLGSIPSPDSSAGGTAAPWDTDLSGMDDLTGFDADLSSESLLSNDDLSNLDDIPSDLDFPPADLDASADNEFDADLDLGFEGEGFEIEAPIAEEPTPDIPAFFDLESDSDSSPSDLQPNLDSLPPELLAPEALAFEDLGAAADLDLSEPAAFAGDDWVSDESGLAADDDLSNYDELGAYDELGSADFAADDFDLAGEEIGAEATDTPFSSDFELGTASEDIVLDPLGADAFTPEESSLGVSESEAQSWAAEDSGFDPDLDLTSSADFDDEPEGGFDPGLAFEPEAETPYTTPNPFAVEDYGAGFGADADMPFSTMELDQTVEGDFIPDLPLANDPEGDDDAFLQRSEDYSAEAVPASIFGLGDDGEDDPAFESVEFGNDELGSSGFEPVGLSEGLETQDFAVEGFEDESFGAEGFEDQGFDAGGFSDGSLDSNGFIQDRNGMALMDDEPDATDDFIQEFGSDPSTHVSLTPEQFNDDGSVRRTGGGSGLPMRLIVGLGLGALALALVGLLLNGLLGRLRQPAPGGDPAITEPAVPPPVDPAAVPTEDLFRQAVNAAQTAANQAQTATTPAQWQEVADAWAQAIDLMQRVPASDPNYATAQQKAIDYQPNLDYARQNAQ